MTSKLVVNTIEADTGISSVSFGSSISLSSTSKFFFSDAGIDIGADTNINRPASGVIGFNINSGEKVRITSDGKVGIGDNTPENKLKITVTSGNDGIVVQNTSTANIALIGARNGDATLQIGQYGSTASGNVFGVAAANLAFMYTTSYASTHPSALLIGNSSNKDIIFATDSTQRLRITSSGSVGINVSTPSAGDMASGASFGVPKLHVAGNTSQSGAYELLARFQSGADADNTGATIVLNHQNDRGLAIQGGRRTGNYAHGALKMIDNVGRLSDAIFIHGGNGQGVNHMGFYTGESTTTTERIHIASDGDVGIGTNSPVERLHVHKASATGPFMYITNTSTGVSASDGIQIGYDGTNTAVFKNNEPTDLVFYAGSQNFRITSSGHVLPATNNTQDLGSTAKGWRNVYMNDLNLSNMNGDTNDVDGTQGSWTIQEGKDDLYIINRLNGKKFKIKMEEIS